MLKNYEDGMTHGGEGLHERSKFVLEHSTGEESLSGREATGRFVPVSLEYTNPKNEEMDIPGPSRVAEDEGGGRLGKGTNKNYED